MHKALFLLCPTDCLETTINATFKHQNYFYTSLGNSFASDIETLENIKELLIKHNINNIYFILSSDNKIILDALKGYFFSEIKGLQKFYTEIRKQQKHLEAIQLTENNQYSIISYFLNHKIKELQFYLSNFHNHSVKINGKVYDRFENSFKNIYSSLICIKKHNLN